MRLGESKREALGVLAATRNLPMLLLGLRIIAITGQSLPIFTQVLWSFLISARILMRRTESRRRRVRALAFVSERRNISMAC